MRLVFGAALIAAFAASTIPAFADAKADFVSAFTAFSHVSSYHADITTSDGKSIGFDQIVPNKMHMTMNGGAIQMIKIDSDIWVMHGGGWMRLPQAMPQVDTFVTMAHPSVLNGGEDQNTMTVSFAGSETIDKVAARHYKITDSKSNQTSDVWVGPNNLPLKIVSHAARGDSTIVYSNYNGVADITPPAM